jgi:hypothetical protein
MKHIKSPLKINLSLLNKNNIAIYCENLTKYTSTPTTQNEKFWRVKPCGIYKNHRAQNDKENIKTLQPLFIRSVAEKALRNSYSLYRLPDLIPWYYQNMM